MLQTIDRAVAVLDLLSRAPQGLRLSVMARELGLKDQTLHGIVRSLQARNLVVQPVRGGAYLMGPRPILWFEAWKAGNGPATAVRDLVEQLATDLRESVVLAELCGGNLVGLVHVQADQDVVLNIRLGTGQALHAMATGKLLLAYQPEPIRREILATLEMPRMGPNTITKTVDLSKEIEKIRRQGYSHSDQEVGAGVSALAVPVRWVDGSVRHALGVSAPSMRMKKDRLPAMLEKARRIAAQIEARWGSAGASPPASSCSRLRAKPCPRERPSAL